MFKSLFVTTLVSFLVGVKTPINNPIDEVAYTPSTNQINVYQGVRNGKPSSLDYISHSSGNASLVNNQLLYNFNNYGFLSFSSNLPLINGSNVIYYSFNFFNGTEHDSTSIIDFTFNNVFGFEYSSNYSSSSTYVNGSGYHRYSFTFSKNTSHSDDFLSGFSFDFSRNGANVDLYLGNVQLYNLTSIFGSGNEPSKTVFDNMLGNQYYDYGSHKIDLDWSTGERVYGLYNLKDVISWTDDDLPYYDSTEGDTTIYFEDDDIGYWHLVPMLWEGETVFLKSITFFWDKIGEYIELTLDYYNYVAVGYTESITLGSGSTLLNLEQVDDARDNWCSLIIYIQQTPTLSIRGNQFFNIFFTHDDNAYVTSYSGYYNFTNTSTINSPFNVFGGFTFNNSLYFGLTNSLYGVFNDSFRCAHWGYPDDWTSNGVVNGFYYESYDLPISSSQVVNSNFQFNNVKLSNDSYDLLSTVGTWQFVRDTSYDNADFYDLMFAIADTPIYFISRILSFELFGMNLFVALTGLLTVCAILVLIRKFF